MTADALEIVGVSAVYTPAGGTGIETRVVIDESLDAFGQDERLHEGEVLMSVLRTDAGAVNGVGTPDNGDTIEITDPDSQFNGQTFTVHEARERDGYVSRVVVI